MTWATLFERAAGHDVDLPVVRAALADRRETREGAADKEDDDAEDDDAEDGDLEREADQTQGADPTRESDPTRIVADADVLAADLLVGGAAREALDHVRSHSWLSLVASDPLLADARAVVATLADETLAEDWYEQVEEIRAPVDHVEGDHPALGSAYEGNSAHVLTFDEDLASAQANLSLQSRVAVSVRSPEAFAQTFDPGSLYEATQGGTYPGPDRDPRG